MTRLKGVSYGSHDGGWIYFGPNRDNNFKNSSRFHILPQFCSSSIHFAAKLIMPANQGSISSFDTKFYTLNFSANEKSLKQRQTSKDLVQFTVQHTENRFFRQLVNAAVLLTISIFDSKRKNPLSQSASPHTRIVSRQAMKTFLDVGEKSGILIRHILVYTH